MTMTNGDDRDNQTPASERANRTTLVVTGVALVLVAVLLGLMWRPKMAQDAGRPAAGDVGEHPAPEPAVEQDATQKPTAEVPLKQIVAPPKFDVQTAKHVTIAYPVVESGVPSSSKAVLQIKAQIGNPSNAARSVTVEGKILDPFGELCATFSDIVEVEANGGSEYARKVEIVSPQLWWPVGLGDQPLYTLDLTAGSGTSDDSAKRARVVMPFGVREIALAAGNGEGGYEADFKANGAERFRLNTAVWPAMELPGPLVPERYERLVRLVAAQGINSLAVSQGIEPDEFYTLCDRYGVLVLQWIPLKLADDPTKSSLSQIEEAQQIASSLRRHPCVLFWFVGDDALDERTRELARTLQARCDPTRMFFPGDVTEAATTLWAKAYDERRHMSDWRAVSFERTSLPRGAPAVASLAASSVKAEELWPPSVAWGIDPTRVDAFIGEAEKYGRAADLDQFCARSQLAQAVSLRRTLEAGLLRGTRRGGMLIDPMNETAPGVGSGMIDWFSRPKISYYFLKRELADLHILADFGSSSPAAVRFERGETFTIDVHVANTGAEPIHNLVAKAKLLGADLFLIASDAEDVSLEPGQIKRVTTLTGTIPVDLQDDLAFLRLSLDDADGRTRADNLYWIGITLGDRSAGKLRVLWIADEENFPAAQWSFLSDHGCHVEFMSAARAGVGASSRRRERDEAFEDHDQEDFDEGETYEPFPRSAGISSEYDVLVVDGAVGVDHRLLSDVAASVREGAGLFLNGVSSGIRETPLNALCPVDVKAETEMVDVTAIQAKLPHHPVLAGLSTDAVLILSQAPAYPLREGAATLLSVGPAAGLLVEGDAGRGRVLASLPRLSREMRGPQFESFVAGLISYLGKRTYPQLVRFRRRQTVAPYEGLNNLPPVGLEVKLTPVPASPKPGHAAHALDVRVGNEQDHIAFMVAARFEGLPEFAQTIWSDNGFWLLPGEARTLRAEVVWPAKRDWKGTVKCCVSAWNSPVQRLALAMPGPDGRPTTIAAEPLRIAEVKSASPTTALWQLTELAAQIDGVSGNPFQDVLLTCKLRPPSGKEQVVHGFHDGGSTWRVRFMPHEQGDWSYELTASRGDATDMKTGTLRVVVSSAPGPIRVAPGNPRALAHANGEPFCAMGGGAFSLWQDWVTGTRSWSEYLDAHHQHRMNCMRIFLYQEAHRGRSSHEVANLIQEGFTDRYDLDVAKRLDAVFAQAQDQQIAVILTFFDHWSKRHDWGRSVFARENGGPCAGADDMLDKPAAIEIEKKMMAYAIRRWGAYANLMAWELWNEIDLVPGTDLSSDGASLKWHRAMAKFVKDEDPYDHLVFTSFSSGVIEPKWYAEPWNEIISYHHYAAYNGGRPNTVDDDLAAALGPFQARAKPILVAELGYMKNKHDESRQKIDYLRVATWAVVFQGSSFVLWDDQDFRIIDRTREQIDVLARFYGENDLASMRPAGGGGKSMPKAGLRAWRLVEPGRRQAIYIHNFRNHAAPARGQRVPIAVRRSGKYKLRWFDPKTGKYVKTVRETFRSRLKIVRIPEFRTDIALVMTRQ